MSEHMSEQPVCIPELSWKHESASSSQRARKCQNERQNMPTYTSHSIVHGRNTCQYIFQNTSWPGKIYQSNYMSNCMGGWGQFEVYNVCLNIDRTCLHENFTNDSLSCLIGTPERSSNHIAWGPLQLLHICLAGSVPLWLFVAAPFGYHFMPCSGIKRSNIFFKL